MNEPILTEERIAFLEALRDSGVTNMFGATPYLVEEFHLTQDVARDILCQWMESFKEETQEMPEQTITKIHRLIDPTGEMMVTFQKHNEKCHLIRHYNATDHDAPILGWRLDSKKTHETYVNGFWPTMSARNEWSNYLRDGWSINTNDSSRCLTQEELRDSNSAEHERTVAAGLLASTSSVSRRVAAMTLEKKENSNYALEA